MYKRILVAVDGSESSNKALTAALQFAREVGGQVRLVHVVDELSYVSGYGLYGGSSADLFNILRQSGEKTLADSLDICKAAGVPADTAIFDNLSERMADIVIHEAERWNADLIVVGKHGRRGLGRVMLGSGAEQILRLAPVPVLVVRTKEASNSKT